MFVDLADYETVSWVHKHVHVQAGGIPTCFSRRPFPKYLFTQYGVSIAIYLFLQQTIRPRAQLQVINI